MIKQLNRKRIKSESLKWLMCVCVFFIHDFDQIVINHDMKWKHTIIDIVEYESHDHI